MVFVNIREKYYSGGVGYYYDAQPPRPPQSCFRIGSIIPKPAPKASAKKQQYIPVKYYWMVDNSYQSGIIHSIVNQKGNKMNLKDAVTTIGFTDAEMDVLYDALNAYSINADLADMDNNLADGTTDSIIDSVLRKIHEANLD